MWFNWGPNDLWAELRLLNQGLGNLARTLTRIERKQDISMALVAIEQSDLDAIAVTIEQVADTLQAVLDSDTPLAPADESGVQDALRKLQAVGPRVPDNAPPVSEPVDPDAPETPETPAGDESPADSPAETAPAPEPVEVPVDDTPSPVVDSPESAPDPLAPAESDDE